jgi:hypothetical protein
MVDVRVQGYFSETLEMCLVYWQVTPGNGEKLPPV